ncbi:MAG: hypothetical protein QOI97_253, partial [Pseudomonas sp.]|nr:hypothetical protein [Pseudomonas sp.]
ISISIKSKGVSKKGVRFYAGAFLV